MNKASFEKVHQVIIRAYISLGGTQHFRALRNEILKANGWEYSEYEEAVFQNL